MQGETSSESEELVDPLPLDELLLLEVLLVPLPAPLPPLPPAGWTTAGWGGSGGAGGTGGGGGTAAGTSGTSTGTNGFTKVVA